MTTHRWFRLRGRWPARLTNHPSPKGRARPILEALEARLVPADLQVPLDPLLDALGNQFETLQVYRSFDGLGNPVDRVTLGIFDTGASPVTFSFLDQEFFTDAIPVKQNADGTDVTANVEAVGGTLQGLVSEPGTILSDGL